MRELFESNPLPSSRLRSHDVQTYLETFPAHHASTERWPVQGLMHVRLCLSSALPPPQVTSSMLAIVFNGREQLLCLWPDERSPSLSHFLIGGRPEPNESPSQTIVREVAEETGWIVEPIQQIGFRHFLQPEPRNEKTDRPYPDFIQPIFVARALHHDASRLIQADQIPATFIDYSDARASTDPPQRPLLFAARGCL